MSPDDLRLPAPSLRIVATVIKAASAPEVRRIVVATNDTLWADALCRVCDAAFPGCDVSVHRTAGAVLKALGANTTDLVLTSLEFSDENGLVVLERFRQWCRLLLIVSPRKDDWTMMVLRTARFDGFFDPQEDDQAVLAEVLLRIAAGGAYFSLSVKKQLLAPKFASVLAEKLTEMELKVFKIIGDGTTNADAARVLGSSERTVETHRQNIKKKLRVITSAKLVWEAVRLGIARNDPRGQSDNRK